MDEKFKSSLLGRIDSELYDEMLKKHKEEEFKTWDKLITTLISKIKKLPDGEINIDSKESYDELSQIFDLKFKNK